MIDVMFTGAGTPESSRIYTLHLPFFLPFQPVVPLK